MLTCLLSATEPAESHPPAVIAFCKNVKRPSYCIVAPPCSNAAFRQGRHGRRRTPSRNYFTSPQALNFGGRVLAFRGIRQIGIRMNVQETNVS
ncbi:hypothetical protein GGI64_004397 [Rhizobium leguminosarum]|uniref:Uncharacterized protein n=1 Tax=Rhizobium leguminosarum TaxID=384 RepID=A0A7Z0E1G2_RHILE|nr:hypothetical protein [Rhizobium leguminosarum]MBB6219868.1 hypothetical protein [Rhizobium leguminosarum]NYJ13316.1 hypothetical protein [Rhizobium leguminosarum]